MTRRICVVGNSGSGKTYLARRLARRLGLPHVELDAINHLRGWTQAPADEFQAEVRRTLDEHLATYGGWVVDGNYRSRLGNAVYPDTYVWLDYPRRVVALRVVRRTLGRLVLRRELWNGNRERWRSLLSRDPSANIVLWSWTQHDRYHCTYEAASARGGRAEWVHLRSPRDSERWLSSMG